MGGDGDAALPEIAATTEDASVADSGPAVGAEVAVDAQIAVDAGPGVEVADVAVADVVDVADPTAEVFADSAAAVDSTAAPETDVSGPATNCATAPEGTACDDGNPCTTGTVCAAGSCSAGLNLCQCAGDADCAVLDDANLCNGKLFCNKLGFPFQCQVLGSSVVVCANAGKGGCAQETCNPNSGKCETGQTDGDPCNDDNPCTTESFCKAGACVAGNASWCQCTSNADCAALDDADLCNGTLYCDKAAFPFTCKVNPATLVTCPSDADSACAKNVCATASGKCAPLPTELAKQVCDAKGCVWQAKAANEPALGVAPCSDGIAATTGDYCEAGVCKSGTDTSSCASNADCLPQEDGNLCNGTLFCNKALKPAACQLNPATIVTCASGNDTACEKNACAIATGKCDCSASAKQGTCALSPVEIASEVCAAGKCRWESLPYGAPPAPALACDDGNACSKGETCQQGNCGGGTDICVCKADSDCGGQEDGNACNGTLFCNKASKKCELNPASIVVCPSGLDSACVKNICAAKTGQCGLANAPSTTVCDDGDSCTVSDACDNGTCKGGTNTCACSTDSQCGKYEDGDGCNGTLFCDKSKSPALCAVNPATLVTCPSVDDTACLKNTCQPKTGKCQPVKASDGAECSDNVACTQGDSCKAGLCQAGVLACECLVHADCLSKEDGNLCNGTLYCDKSGLVPLCKLNLATIVVCAKGLVACQKTACNPSNGVCQPAPADEGSPCSDGNACTKEEVCQGGACQGKPIDCDDSDACTFDSCSPTGGCQHAAPSCTDKNTCTDDVCDPKTGQCKFLAKGDGLACDADSNGCTVGDTCKGGKCLVGAPVACQLAPGPCELALCNSVSANQFQCIASQKADGADCEDGDACTLGSACAGGVCKGSKAEAYFQKALLAPNSTGGTLFGVAALADGGFAAVGKSLAEGESDPGKAGRWWLVRTDAAGEALWHAQPYGAEGLDAKAVVQHDGGDLYVAGSVQKSGEGGDAAVVRWPAGTATGTLAGSAVWQKSLGKAGAVDERGLGLCRHKTGGVVLVGYRETSGDRNPWVVRVSGSGQMVWELEVVAPKAGEALACTVLADGAVLVAGYVTDGGGVPRGWTARVSVAGVLQSENSYGLTADQRFVGVATTADGGSVVAGWQVVEGARKPWLSRLDPFGKPVWQRVADGAFDVRALAGLEDGRAVMVGVTGTVDNPDGWQAGHDTLGNVLWDGGIGAPGAASAEAVVGMPDGGVIVAGGTLSNKKAVGLLVRSDPWGHTSCAESGVCVGKTVSGCDDGKPCTRDGCNAKSGCSHDSALALHCPYDDGCALEGTCSGGACKPSSKQKLFQRTYAVAEGTELIALTALPEGGIGMLSRTLDNKLHVLRVDKFGDVVLQAKTTVDATAVGGAIALANGQLLVSTAAAGKLVLTRLGAELKVVTAKDYGWLTPTLDWPCGGCNNYVLPQAIDLVPALSSGDVLLAAGGASTTGSCLVGVQSVWRRIKLATGAVPGSSDFFGPCPKQLWRPYKLSGE